MKRATIELRIQTLSIMLAEATAPEDIRVLNSLIERLIMMESDEERGVAADEPSLRINHTGAKT